MAEEKSKKTVRQISVEMYAGHINRTEQYARQVGVLYDEAIREATRIGISLSAVDSSVPFTFDHYPEVKERVNKMVKSLFNGVNTVISSGTREEWLKSAKKNDAVVDLMLERTPFTRAQLEDMYDRNMEALAAFQKRKINGLGLSEKVWKLSEQFRNDIEMGLDIGLADGRSADELSRDLRQYLNEPSRLFARIRDKEDSARFYLSENAKRYHPGAGMYRSSYKNAMRLTRTEINMAYRTSDHERWKQLGFVVGFEVKLSNNHTLNGMAFTDICDELAGKYPKSFKFVGWHPQCRCFVIPVLATEQEFVDWQQRRLDGDKAAVLRSGEEIKDIPPAFVQWLENNSERINNAKHIPYFLKDNQQIVSQIVNKSMLSSQAVQLPKFVPSKSVEEAKTFLLNNIPFIADVDYSELTLDQANRINNTIQDIYEMGIITGKYKFNLVGFKAMPNDIAGGGYQMFKHPQGTATLRIAGNFDDIVKNDDSIQINNLKKTFKLRLKTTDSAYNEVMKDIETYLKDPEEDIITWREDRYPKLLKRKEIIEQLRKEMVSDYETKLKNFKPHHSNRALNLEDCIKHEFGHVLEADLQGAFESYSKEVQDAIGVLKNRSGYMLNNKQLLHSPSSHFLDDACRKYGASISEYASTEGAEYFAESFLAFLQGDVLEDKELNNLFKKLLKK